MRGDYEEDGGCSLATGGGWSNQYVAVSSGHELLISSTEKNFFSLLPKMIYQHKKSNFKPRDLLLSQTNWSRSFKDVTFKMLL